MGPTKKGHISLRWSEIPYMYEIVFTIYQLFCSSSIRKMHYRAFVNIIVLSVTAYTLNSVKQYQHSNGNDNGGVIGYQHNVSDHNNAHNASDNAKPLFWTNISKYSTFFVPLDTYEITVFCQCKNINVEKTIWLRIGQEAIKLYFKFITGKQRNTLQHIQFIKKRIGGNASIPLAYAPYKYHAVFDPILKY